nr:PREDICTED: migration and invasion-inhibitory protein isoform X2 [Latimeria chalumnae]|eukprot:XP_014344181.1 PREDICTED: migration and invasion-inhibitory protein isoform X2 [Latimeria chalumnae]
MSDFDYLELLRNRNKRLLQRLRAKQEEFGNLREMKTPSGENKPADRISLPPSLSNRRIVKEQAVMVQEEGDVRPQNKMSLSQSKEPTAACSSKDLDEPVLVVPSGQQGKAYAALCTSCKDRGKSLDCRGPLGSGSKEELEKENINTMNNTIVTENLQATDQNSCSFQEGNSSAKSGNQSQNRHEKNDFKTSTPFQKLVVSEIPDQEVLSEKTAKLEWEGNVKHLENGICRHRHHSAFLQTQSQEFKGRTELEPVLYAARLYDEGNNREKKEFIREVKKPRSILLAPWEKDNRRQASHVTFQSHDEEHMLSSREWSVQPFLGYDWIAGLLDTDASVSEKSEVYFSELKEFRQVNKEECIHREYMEAEELNLVAPVHMKVEQELDSKADSHQCSHCYRVNSRLFTVPLDPEATCPVCKAPRSSRPHTTEEPAYVRVSIPRSTLLPPYRHRAHRRKSFDPSDSLALPSNTSASRVVGSTTSDKLLNLSRSTRYHLQELDRSLGWNQNKPHSTTYPVY